MKNYGHIKITNATFGYRKSGKVLEILHDINMECNGGDFVGIVGLNGTGKSTLIKSICGLLPLLKGNVMIDGSPINDFSLNELARKVAIVLTEKIGGFNLTVFDAVAAGQMPYTDSFNRLTLKNKQAIESAIEACRMTPHKDTLLNELSDGMFQKAVIAKALAQETPVILLDEPSAFLDYASKHDLFRLLKKLADEDGKCVLISSHDLDLVLRYCNKLCVVSNGKTEIIDVTQAKQNINFMEIGGGFI